MQNEYKHRETTNINMIEYYTTQLNARQNYSTECNTEQ